MNSVSTSMCSPVLLGPDSDKLFNLLANTQAQRLDDQRATLPSLPATEDEKPTTSGAAGESSYLCYMVSKVQVSLS